MLLVVYSIVQSIPLRYTCILCTLLPLVYQPRYVYILYSAVFHLPVFYAYNNYSTLLLPAYSPIEYVDIDVTPSRVVTTR